MNLDPEIRRGYYVSAEMKKAWAVEMQLLKKLLEVCEKHHLHVFAEGGTLLGAVREHGYIPWDDDIDMAMPREDYDKLRNIANEEFKAPYFFQCGYTDLFPNGLTRLRMNDTAAIFKSSIFHTCHQGIFIDIFPLDVLPSNQILYKKLLKQRIRKRKMMKTYCDYHFSFSNWVYNLRYLYACLIIGSKGFTNYFRKYEEIIKCGSNERSDYLSLLSWSEDSKYLRKKDWYNHTDFFPFEDIYIPVPSGYNFILTKQYGEYMKPVHEPTMHGGYLVLDTEKSYSYYLPNLRKNHKWDIWKNRWLFLRNFILK